MPDSGRNVSEAETQFDFDSLLSKKYAPAFDFTYSPFIATKIGCDINSGINRNGTIGSDIRNNESTVDFKVTYNKDGRDHSRIIRINR
jgi:hypothetical protein